jgi:hypothetical protein
VGVIQIERTQRSIEKQERGINCVFILNYWHTRKGLAIQSARYCAHCTVHNSK